MTATSGRGAPAQGGWHPSEWACEFLGTALLLLGGLSAICLTMGPHSPVRPHVPSESARLLITGVLFAGTGSLMALSPWGRRSGAHLNPAVTLAFWIQGKVHPHDVLGHVLGQALGAVAGTGAVALLWGATGQAVRLGATTPGRAMGDWQAVGVEALMTATLVLMILLLTSDARTARWTPLGNLLLVAVLVWRVAPLTGTSLNPARSLGPAVLLPSMSSFWVYLLGPLSGSLAACGVFRLVRSRRTLTAKLFHDPAYRSMLGSELAVSGR